MDFRERILTTMEHEEPDRVPVMSLLNEPSNVYQLSGKSPTGYFSYLKKPILKDLVRLFMNWNYFWNREFFKTYKMILETSIQLGFDATWLMYLIFKLKREKTFPLGMAWYDPYGRMWDIKVDSYGNPEPYYVGGYCDTEQKWEEWVEKRRPLLDKHIQFATEFYQKMYEACGDRIYIVGFAAPGIFENSWQPIGFVKFVKLIYERPSFIEKVVEFQTEYYLKHLEAVCKTGAEIVLAGDDLGQKTGPLMSPQLIDRFFGPSYRQVADFVHKQGKKLIFHSCGKIYKLLDLFIDYGFDGLLTLEPTASMDLKTVRQIVGHKLVLVGNIDVSYLLVRGSKQEIEAAVKHAIKVAAPGGGFILSPAHNHEAVDPIRLQWMIEAAHKYGEYPIQI
ncbi:MAG: uroporphyrinogen decarboxylase family protein [Candidatus Helarchaeota archaeon]